MRTFLYLTYQAVEEIARELVAEAAENAEKASKEAASWREKWNIATNRAAQADQKVSRVQCSCDSFLYCKYQEMPIFEYHMVELASYALFGQYPREIRRISLRNNHAFRSAMGHNMLND